MRVGALRVECGDSVGVRERVADVIAIVHVHQLQLVQPALLDRKRIIVLCMIKTDVVEIPVWRSHLSVERSVRVDSTLTRGTTVQQSRLVCGVRERAVEATVRLEATGRATDRRTAMLRTPRVRSRQTPP